MINNKTIINYNSHNWFFISSDKTNKGKINNDPIYLIQQFYIPENNKRFTEIKYALEQNAKNPYIDKIFLLNEKIYTKSSLGTNSKKIFQYNLGRKLMVSDIFEFISYEDLKGYIIFSNTDIFFDNSLLNIKFSNLQNLKKIYSQLRFEYKIGTRLCESFLYKRNYDYIKQFKSIPGWNLYQWDSADTWVIHSNFNLKKSARKYLRLNLGVGGIDQIIPRVFFQDGYLISNEPFYIKTYHIHNESFRDWSKNINGIKRYEEDYLFCFPSIESE